MWVIIKFLTFNLWTFSTCYMSKILKILWGILWYNQIWHWFSQTQVILQNIHCLSKWSLTLPSLFWWILMKNKSQLFRHLNIPFKSIFQGEFNGSFRFSIHSAKLELFHKTYIVLFLFLLCWCIFFQGMTTSHEVSLSM